MRLTVGPLPPAVYWRRRALVLGAALLMVFLVAQACMAANAGRGEEASGDPSSPVPSTSGSGTPDPTDGEPVAGDSADGQPSASPTGESPSPVPSATPEGDRCTDDEMLIIAEAERTEFASGDQVRFYIRIRNDSDRTCERDIGGDLRELYLTQGTGASKVWSSRHCDPPTGSDEKELPSGHEEQFFLRWNGRHSTTCDGDRAAGQEVRPGDYQLRARLGSLHSEPVDLTVTG